MKKFLTLIAIASILVITNSNCVDNSNYGSFSGKNIVTDGTSGNLNIYNKSKETIKLQQEYKGKIGKSIELAPGQTTFQNFTTEFFGSEKYTIKCFASNGNNVSCSEYVDLVLGCPSNKTSNCVKNNALGMD